MQKNRTTFWRVFNALGRVAGVCFAVVGSCVGVSGFTQQDWLIVTAGKAGIRLCWQSNALVPLCLSTNGWATS